MQPITYAFFGIVLIGIFFNFVIVVAFVRHCRKQAAVGNSNVRSNNDAAMDTTKRCSTVSDDSTEIEEIVVVAL